MQLNPNDAHELAYLIGDLSGLCQRTSETYLVYKCPLSQEWKWGIFTEDDEETFDPTSDILIRM